MRWHPPYNPGLETDHTERKAAVEKRSNKTRIQDILSRIKNINDIINCCDVSTIGSTVTVNNQFQHEHSELASINALNIHPVGFCFFSTPSSVSICFHLLHTARLRPHLSPPPTPKNKHTNASHTQKRTGENRAPRKCNISVFNIEVYKIRAEMGSMAICLFIYFIRGGGGKSAYQCLYLGGLGRRIGAHLI